MSEPGPSLLPPGGARLVIREREPKRSMRASGLCVPLDCLVAIARRGRAFFRTPYGPSKTGVLPNALWPVEDGRSSERPIAPRKPGGSPAKTPGSPAKETGSGAKESGKVSKENPSANWAFSMGYDDPAQNPLLPPLPAPLLEAARSATGPLYPWFLIIARKSRALIALAVVGKESGAWRRWRTAPSRRHGRACPGHPRRPSASTQASAKSLATVRLPARRAEAGLVLAAARRGWPGQARP